MRWKSQRTEWELWYAWFPIYLNGEWIWREWVQRRPCDPKYPGWFMGWMYRDYIAERLNRQ